MTCLNYLDFHIASICILKAPNSVLFTYFELNTRGSWVALRRSIHSVLSISKLTPGHHLAGGSAVASEAAGRYDPSL